MEIVKNDCFIGAVRFGNTGFGRLEPRGGIGPARWDWFDLVCVHRGQLVMKVDAPKNLKVELNRGDGLLILPGTRFQGHAADEGVLFSVQHFDLTHAQPSNLMQPLARLFGRSSGFERVCFLGPRSVERDIERAIDLAFTPERVGLHDARVAQLALILDQLQAGEQAQVASDSVDPRVRELLDQLQVFDPREKVTPREMAEWVGLSESRFRVWFKQEFGVSPKRYLMRDRISQAMRRLRETRDPIKSIAYDLGYADLPTFYHDFGRHTKTTPAAYREQHTVLC